MKMRAILALSATLLTASAWAAEGRARVAFVGDVMLAETEGPGRLAAGGGDPFGKVRAMLAKADLRVANFESSAGTTGKADPDKPFSFRTARAALRGLATLFEAASLANNHTGDYGRQDLVETVGALRAAGVQTFGAGATPTEAHRAALVERNGVKIALLGYVDALPRWFAAAPGLPGAAWLDEDQAALDIAKAKAQGADAVVVVPHWGVEHETRAHDRQRRLARMLLDAGADAVIGGHPHVVQDYEIYKGKPIVYSLGNFVFDGFDDENSMTGWVVFADFDKAGVAAIATQGVRMDADGSPGPCWKRGDAAMSVCGKAAPR